MRDKLAMGMAVDALRTSDVVIVPEMAMFMGADMNVMLAAVVALEAVAEASLAVNRRAWVIIGVLLDMIISDVSLPDVFPEINEADKCVATIAGLITMLVLR